MGLDIFSSISNMSSDDNRSIYFSQITRNKLSKSRSYSKDIKISKQSRNGYFDQDYFNEFNDSPSENNTVSFFSSKNINTIPKLEKDELNIPLQPKVDENNDKNDVDKNSNKIQEEDNPNLNNSGALSSKKLIKLKKEAIKNNTIFIFDWDDTLFFTTHLDPSKNSMRFNESALEKKMIKSIEYYVEEILSKALNKGTVLIITNSSEGWVEYCVYSYYKNLIPLLKQINIISARTLYEQEFPSEPLTWKIKTFNDLTEKFNFEKCLLTNIICIGDDNSEIIAAKKLANNFENCLVKTVKLRESPKLKELIKQLILINEQILRVYSYPKSLTIQVDKKKNPKFN
jgi:hypothetical protein